MITEEVSIRKVPANSSADRPKAWLIPLLLPGEHRDDFQALLDAISRDIRPAGFIEELYVNDIAWLVWETIRLRRCRTPILRESYCEALKDILEGLFRRKQITCPGLRAEKLAQNWFTEKDAKEEARNLLMEFELDESDVDAEAVRRSLDDLERVDKLLMANEFRRDKALISIAAFRSSLAKNLRKSSDRLIEAEANEIPLLAAPSVSQSPG